MYTSLSVAHELYMHNNPADTVFILFKIYINTRLAVVRYFRPTRVLKIFIFVPRDTEY